MRLYFMRHGHAEHAHNGITDAERRLTPDGVERVENAAAVLARLDIAPAYIFSSPRVRARQTADIVAAALEMPVNVREEVNFDFSVDAVKDFVAAYGDADLMFVGHEPTLSMTIGAITRGEVVMKPGGFARVDLTSNFAVRGELIWLIAPKVFDVLAG